MAKKSTTKRTPKKKGYVNSGDYNRITGKKYTAKQKKDNARSSKWLF